MSLICLEDSETMKDLAVAIVRLPAIATSCETQNRSNKKYNAMEKAPVFTQNNYGWERVWFCFNSF